MTKKNKHARPLGFCRLSGVAALGFAALLLVGNAILVPAGMPSPGSGPAEAETFFQGAGAVSSAVSASAPAVWVLAVLFGAGAVAVLWPRERQRGEAWSLVGFAGLLMQNATFAGVIAARIVHASTAGQEAGAMGGLWVLHDALLGLNGTFLALALLGLSLAGQRSGLIRPWHAALGLVSAGLNFLSATLTPLVVDVGTPLSLIGLFGWLLWVGWIAAYGVALIRLTPEAHARMAA